MKPDMASLDLEKKMGAAELPESDRDEVRRFAEFLRLPKNEAGKRQVSPEMMVWLCPQKEEP